MRQKATILLLGSGGRESAMGRAVENSPLLGRLLCASGNGGMDSQNCRAVKDSDIPGIVELAQRESVDLVLGGAEGPLVAGVVDKLALVGIPAFGPTAKAAQLESSKIFTKMLCGREKIPTARWQWTDSFDAAERMIRTHSTPPVIKADGLCAGKGVVVPESFDEAIHAAQGMLVGRTFGDAGSKIVIEERLTGREVSVMAFCDGENAVLLPAARDFKRAFDDNKGPNTGGMGSYSPVPDVSDEVLAWVKEHIIMPTLRGMLALGAPFKGVLYAGLMITKDGVFLIEFNVRFGDPETQVILARVKSDVLAFMYACIKQGGLANMPPLEIDERAAVCTVLASDGYPGNYVADMPMIVPEDLPDVHFIHAGTKRRVGELLSAGGRVIGSVGMGATIAQARERSLEGAAAVQFDNKFYRTDIAAGV